jgi:hypothetical protein
MACWMILTCAHQESISWWLLMVTVSNNFSGSGSKPSSSRRNRRAMAFTLPLAFRIYYLVVFLNTVTPPVLSGATMSGSPALGGCPCRFSRLIRPDAPFAFCY